MLSAKNDPSGLMLDESPAELITSKKMDEVAELVEVSLGRSSLTHILESVIDEMACKESCMHNPDQEVRPSLVMISEQWMVTPTSNPDDSRPAVLEEFKTYVDAETQKEPSVCSPVVEVLTPRRKRKLVEIDHAYCKKKMELQPMQPEPSFMPKTLRMTLFKNPTALTTNIFHNET